MSRTRTQPKPSRKTRQSRRLAARGSSGPTDDWAAWLEYLDARPNLFRLCDSVPGASTHPLCWPLTDEWPSSESHRLVTQLAKLCSGQRCSKAELARGLEQWLDTASARTPQPTLGIECLAWCHALPALAQMLSAAPWHELLDWLTQTAEQAAAINLLDNPLSQQLLAGELPASLSYVLPELPDCRGLRAPASRILSQGIVELLDGEGLPHARHLALARPLLACWTRTALLERSLNQRLLSDAARSQFEWLVREGLRLTRHDGSHVFGAGADWSADMWHAALEVAGDDDNCRIAARALPSRKGGTTQRSDNGLPAAAVHSEWAETAVLRRDWDRKSEFLAVTYADQSLRTELDAGGEIIWSGRCHPQVSLDKRPLELQGDWEEVCWVSDDDLDYLELEVSLTRGWVLQRHLALARQDRFLFMADALLGDEPGMIDYECTWPLSDGVRLQAAEETRDGVLQGRRRLAVVLPLALPEWRSQRAEGELEMKQGGLRYGLRSVGSRLFAPLFVDLDPRRTNRQRTWRQLTVAENLEVVRADVAVGYRVQIGSRQWMVYRSLAARASRSVLGQNFSTEYVLARFGSRGQSEKLVEIE